jgi:hypothetical protein
MLRILIALVLLAHGLGHVMGVLAAWTTIPSGLSAGHSLLSSSITLDSPVGRAASLLWVLALVLTVGAGAGLLFQQEWWAALSVAAAICSLLAIGPWLNVLPVGSGIGAVAVDVVVLGGLLGPWHDTLLRWLR